ncbi:MAG: histidine phosphatase family protein [Desulfobacterales bacterium]|nr:MAG: histidine phosphatase family protein [Desulfobacterales bacterium]
MVKTGFIPQNETTRISLVRHAKVHNPSNIFYGRLPRFSLSPSGHLEATQTAQAFKHLMIDDLITSPLLRCRQTAKQILKYHQHIKLRQSRLINEVLTPFQGKTTNVVDARNGDVYTGIDPTYEQPKDILFRAQRFLYRIRIKCFKKHAVAVTHGDIVLFMLLWASNMPTTPQNKIKFTTLNIIDEYPATSSITTFCYATDRKDERPSVTYFNPNRQLA